MHPRKAAAAGLLVLLLGAGGLGGYWYWAADQVATAIARWAGEQRARGYRVAYDGPFIGGFPFALSVRLKQPSIASPRGWRWSGSTLGGKATFWAPLRLRLVLPPRQTLLTTWPRERRFAIETGEATGLVDFAPNGRVEAATIQMKDLVLRAEQAWIARIAQLRYDLTTRPPAPDGAGEPVVALRATATGVGVPETVNAPFGDTVDRVAIEAAVIVPVPPGDPATAMAAWRD